MFTNTVLCPKEVGMCWNIYLLLFIDLYFLCAATLSLKKNINTTLSDPTYP